MTAPRLDRELRRGGDNWWLEIEPTDSKNRPAYLVPLAQNLTAPLECYLEHRRLVEGVHIATIFGRARARASASVHSAIMQ